MDPLVAIGGFILGVIATRIGVLTYRQTQIKVIAVAIELPFLLPDVYSSILFEGTKALGARSSGEPLPKDLPQVVNNLLDRFASAHSQGIDGLREMISRVWVIQITNRGHDTVEGANLSVGGAKVARISGAQMDVPLGVTPLLLPEIRPDSSLQATVWASEASYLDGMPRLTLRKGKAKVRIWRYDNLHISRVR